MKRAIPAALALALAAAAPAGALIEPGNIGALPGNPYPTQPGVTVNGTLFTNQPLPPPPASATPQDYLKFTVTSPGETIVFTDQNTTTGINPHTCSDYCPVYLSLVDSSLRGLGDGAGTIATYGDTENIPWTFATPGTYYIVMESNGDVNLSYATSYAVVSGGGGGCQQNCNPPPPTVPPLVRTLHVSPKQRGTAVNAFITPGQSLRSARVSVLYGKRTIATQTRRSLGTVRHRFTLHLPAAYRHKLKAHHKLHVVVRITATGETGASVTYNRSVTLT